MQLPPTGLTNVVAVAAGGSHSLALQKDGTVIGWGWNRVGEATGIPTPADINGECYSSGQVRLGGQALSNVTAIAADRGYSLALKHDGSVGSWGRMINDLYPAFVPSGLSNVIAIAAGENFCLAITTNTTMTLEHAGK